MARFAWGPIGAANRVTFRSIPYQPLTLDLDLDEDHPADNLEIVLARGVLVRGAARNREGASLAGLDLEWKRKTAGGLEHVKCRTDDAGGFELPGLFPDGYRVTPKCLHAEEVEVVLSDEPVQDVTLVFDLHPPTFVEVKDALGGTVEDARVGWSYSAARGRASGGKQTGKDGRCVLAAPPTRGRLELSAAKDGVGAVRRVFDLSVEPGAYELRLEPDGAVEGQVLDAGGTAVPSCRVWFGHAGAATDTQGRFRVKLAAGTYRFVASCGREGMAEAAGVEVRPGETTDVTLVIDPARCVRGQVLDCEGAPLRYASVELRALEPAGARNWFTPLLDEDGSFAMLLEGEYEARAFARRGPPGPARRVRWGDPPADLTVCCDLERKVVVRVLHEGTPVGGADVRCFNAITRGYLAPPARSAHTGNDGTVEYQGLDAGAFRAVFTARGPGFAFARSAEIDVPVDGLAGEVLVESVPGGDLELRLRRRSGRPAGDLPVFLRSEGPLPIEIEGHTEDEGILRLPRLRTRFSWGHGSGLVEIEIPYP